MAQSLDTILRPLITKVSRRTEGGQDVIVLKKGGTNIKIPVSNSVVNSSTGTYE